MNEDNDSLGAVISDQILSRIYAMRSKAVTKTSFASHSTLLRFLGLVGRATPVAPNNLIALISASILSRLFSQRPLLGSLFFSLSLYLSLYLTL